MANNLEDMSLDSQLIVYNSSVDLTDKTPQKLTRGTTIQALGDLVLGGSKDGFLKTADGGALSTTYKTITDGLGNNSPLELTRFGARISEQWTFNSNSLSSNRATGEIRLNGDYASINLSGAGSVIITNGSIYTPRLYITGSSSTSIRVTNGEGAAGQVLAKRAAGGYEWITPSSGGASWTYSTFSSAAPANFYAPTFSVRKLGTEVWQEGTMQCYNSTNITTTPWISHLGQWAMAVVLNSVAAYPMLYNADYKIANVLYNSQAYTLPTRKIGRWSCDAQFSSPPNAYTIHRGSGTILAYFYEIFFQGESYYYPAIILVSDTGGNVLVSQGDTITMQFNYTTTQS